MELFFKFSMSTQRKKLHYYRRVQKRKRDTQICVFIIINLKLKINKKEEKNKESLQLINLGKAFLVQLSKLTIFIKPKFGGLGSLYST